MEHTSISGVVSLKRKRSIFAGGKVSALRGETCVKCGRTEIFADNPDRLFPDYR